MSFSLYYNKCRENKTENGLGFSSSSLVSYLKDYSKFSSPNSTPFVGYSSKFLMSWPISSIIYGCYRQCDGWLIRNASHDLWVYIYSWWQRHENDDYRWKCQQKKMFLWIFITSKINIPQNRWNYLKYKFLLS
jgi:hypothetical protein